ncbi:hypothetical protein VK792_03465 [Mesobacterium sp. TK19101]|uniref:Uncharacterized protein n=1 Tax=Mesobacterium hydrothermale TaxID=3111907 RepID=A0ABU6HEA8_9RHOB|nr:hypothetical protein [Mesobacterium sp. TK19101]MEC3860331.1 hypothetical protein [Mesobacterium sp. TK19101]
MKLRPKKPLWVRLASKALSMALVLAMSQALIRDPQVMAALQNAAIRVGEFVATEIAYREAQKQGQVPRSPQAAAPQPRAVAVDVPPSGVRVNRPGTGEGGFKRVIVGQ